MRLKDKVAIVAGVGPDIGKRAALTFAREGAAVALVSRTESRLQAIAKEIEAAGGRALVVPTDITDEAQVKAMVEKVHGTFGRIDLLMNNATYSGPVRDLADMPTDEWNEVLLGALTGYMFTIRETIKHMIEQKSGSIVNVSSGAGSVGFRRRSAYGAAKAGVNNMTHTLSFELGPQGIRINAIVVGAVETENFGAGAVERANALGISIEELRARWAKRSPLRRMVQPQEVANLALFLLSDESSAMTGQVINCTAGVLQ